MLDESLGIISRLWSGEPYTHEGTHYTVADVTFLPRPLQRPRPAIWLAGRWPYKRPISRAARWDGLMERLARPPVGDTATEAPLR